MSPFSYEAELIGLAIALYLFDSSVLLYANQGIMTCSRGGHWSVSSGWRGFLLAGRTVCVVNPFAPQEPAFRLGWRINRPVPSPIDHGWSQLAVPLHRLRWPVVIAGTALFVLLPIGLFTRAGVYATVTALTLLYGSTAVGLYLLHGQRQQLDMNGRHFWGFAFECMACPPFAVNMVRRLSLARAVSEPLPGAAARLLDRSAWTSFYTDCAGRLEAELQRTTPGSPEQLALMSQRSWLDGLGSGG